MEPLTKSIMITYNAQNSVDQEAHTAPVAITGYIIGVEN
jgi:hypothetical protein